MPSKATTRTAVLELLAEEGPMTAREIAEQLGVHHRAVASSIRLARETQPGQVFAIVDWRPTRGRGGAIAPVFHAVARPDAPRLKIDPMDRRRRYNQKVAGLVRLRQRIKRGHSINPWLQLMP